MAGADSSSFLSEFIDDGSTESHKYYIARKTVLEMLQDRGYAVPNSDIDLSLKEFREKHGQSPDIDALKIISLHKDDPSAKVLVIFCSPRIIKVNVIRNISEMIMKNPTLSRLILVVQNKMTGQAQKALDALKLKVEIFEINDLLVNITKHELKPKHQVLSAQEKAELLNKFSIDEKQLPRMPEDDAIARYYGLEKGQVLKFTYTGELTQLHVSYRIIY